MIEPVLQLPSPSQLRDELQRAVAFHLNIELGLLVHGGDLPRLVAQHWGSLIEAGGIKRVRA